MTHMRNRPVVVLVMLFVACSGWALVGQQPRPATPQPLAGAATLTVRLVDPEKNAARRAATIDVRATGIELVDPATTGEKPQSGQGHLHYQVDSGFIIATTATKLSFHELKPGEHVIAVTLAANDHASLGAPQEVRVRVPGAVAQHP